MTADGADQEPQTQSQKVATAIRRVEESQVRFDRAIETLDDATARRPSLLPGWTVGHVLSHVARNADSHVHRSEAAACGLVVEQYAGGRPGRAAAIEAGASRSATALVSDVRDSGAAVVACWWSLEEPVWANTVTGVAGREHALWWLPGRRWQELEIHLVDLGIGITFEDWPEDFVSDRLGALRPKLRARLARGAAMPAEGSLSDREELAWMFGRFDRADLPQLESWE